MPPIAGPIMSKWQEENAEKNRRSLLRLNKALPDIWSTPSDYAQLLRRLQARRCGETGGRLWKSAEVDHRTPLFRVWSEYRNEPWPALLDYWGLPNLQLINRDVHVAKCVTEAQHRRAARCPVTG